MLYIYTIQIENLHSYSGAKMNFAVVIFCCVFITTATAFSRRIHHETSIKEISLGGKIATKGQFPYIVSLQLKLKYSPKFIHYCGGSIISEHTVVTAAHCLTGGLLRPEFRVVAGEHNLSVIEGNEQIRDVLFFKVHEDFVFGEKFGAKANDVGVIFVTKPFEFNRFVQAIPLSPANITVRHDLGTLAGWGDTINSIFAPTPDILQTIKMPVLSEKACIEIIEKRNISINAEFLLNTLCGGPMKKGVGPCHGDSGGPFVVNEVLVGITTWTSGVCGDNGFPTGFTRVSVYTKWILDADRALKKTAMRYGYIKKTVA